VGVRQVPKNKYTIRYRSTANRIHVSSNSIPSVMYSLGYRPCYSTNDSSMSPASSKTYFLFLYVIKKLKSNFHPLSCYSLVGFHKTIITPSQFQCQTVVLSEISRKQRRYTVAVQYRIDQTSMQAPSQWLG
jgi:hypothetical protein